MPISGMAKGTKMGRGISNLEINNDGKHLDSPNESQLDGIATEPVGTGFHDHGGTLA